MDITSECVDHDEPSGCWYENRLQRHPRISRAGIVGIRTIDLLVSSQPVYHLGYPRSESCSRKYFNAHITDFWKHCRTVVYRSKIFKWSTCTERPQEWSILNSRTCSFELYLQGKTIQFGPTSIVSRNSRIIQLFDSRENSPIITAIHYRVGQ